MSAAASIRAAAALEIRRRQAAGSDRVGVLVKSFDGNGWRWRGARIDDDEADAIRRTWRGQLIVVNRSPAPMPAMASDTEKTASAKPTPTSWNGA